MAGNFSHGVMHALLSTPIHKILGSPMMTILSLKNQDPQTPPAKQVSSDTSNEVVTDLGKEKEDGNLKELLVRMEKRVKICKNKQVQIDGTLDCLMQYLKNGNDACGAVVKKWMANL